MAKEFLSNLNIHGAGQIQFKTAAGANAGKIDQDGNNLVLTNAVGDVLLGDGSSDVFIGDGTNNVDIIFEQSGAIKGDGSAVTLTLGGANTTLNLENPNINGALSLSNKLTFTSANGYILFDYEPATGSNAEYSSEVPLLKVDRAGTELTVMSRLTNNGALAIGIDDTVAIVAGDTKAVIKDNINYTGEKVVFASESGFIAYGFPDNNTSWANRNVFQFRSESAAAGDNGLYIGDGGQTQFIDLQRNLLNIADITLTGNITFDDGSITSNGTTFAFDGASGKEVLISSARDVRIVIDDNDDDTDNQFEVYKHGVSNANRLLRMDQSGNMDIAGSFTASGYNDSNWNTAYNNSITAAAFSGTTTKTLTLTQQDGGTITAQFTDQAGSTGTTINNNANNRVITGSGTANTLEAESGLTFNNSDSDGLSIGGGSVNAMLQLHTKDSSMSTRQADILFHVDGSDVSRLRFNNNVSGIATNTLTYNVGANPKFYLYADGNAQIVGYMTSTRFRDADDTTYLLNPAGTDTVLNQVSFGVPGGGSNTKSRYLSIEGNADGSGEGSGRIFFTEHNSSTTSMSKYGMSIGYRGGNNTITGTDGNTWTGLQDIGNGQWGMWGHNNSANGSLIMYGDRAATFVDFLGNDIKQAVLTSNVTGGAGLNAVSYTNLTNVPSSFTPSAHTQAFSTITNTPTTLAGYGITDAQASGNYITGTGSLSAQDLTDISNLSGTNTGDQDISGIATNATAISGKVAKAGDTMTGNLTVEGIVQADDGFSSDGNNKFYSWRALENTGSSSNQYHKIARISGGQSSRFIIELAGRSSSYGDTALPAFGKIVGQLNNDNNYDIVYYNASATDEVVDEVGQVDVSTAATDIYVRVGQFSELTATAHISDGTITPTSGLPQNGSVSAPTNYVQATEYKLWNTGNDGSGSGLDADTVDGIQGANIIDKKSGGSSADIDTFTDNAMRSLSYSGHSRHLMSFNLGGSPGTTQQEWHYNGQYRFRNKVDNNNWSNWRYVVSTTTNQDELSGTIWHSGNDGPNSGLDADTLDGNHASAFLTSHQDISGKVDVAGDTMTGSLTIGDGSADTRLIIKRVDGNAADDIQFFNGTTRVGEIGTKDTTWLRINQQTSKNIYTPRYIRADNGFFVDGTTKGINGSGNFIGGTITGASDANVSNWDTAYSWGNHADAGYLTSTSPVPAHTQAISTITNLQSSLDNKTGLNDIRSLGVEAFTGGTNPNITTAQLISEIETDGGFDSYSSVFKTSWSYAGNYNLNDAGRFTETAGTSWITWTDNSSDTTRGNITALAIAPNTGGSAGRVFIYNDQGNSYSPGWREVWTSTSDGTGSGLDADKLDNEEGSYYLDYNNFSNVPSSFTPAQHTQAISTITGLQTALDSKLPKSGGTMTGNLVMNNTNITGVNVLTFNDPGPNEGISWSGGNTKIYESPDNLTGNSAGNLQFVYSGTRRLTVNNTGIDVNGNIVVSGTVDGRNIATDGTKLDTIATNADVTPSWVPSSNPNYLTSSSTQSKYLRSDADDTATGDLTLSGRLKVSSLVSDSLIGYHAGTTASTYKQKYGTLAVDVDGKVGIAEKEITFSIEGNGWINRHSNPVKILDAPGADKMIVVQEINILIQYSAPIGIGSQGICRTTDNTAYMIGFFQGSGTNGNFTVTGVMPRNTMQNTTTTNNRILNRDVPVEGTKHYPNKALYWKTTRDAPINLPTTHPGAQHIVKVKYRILDVSTEFENAYDSSTNINSTSVTSISQAY